MNHKQMLRQHHYKTKAGEHFLYLLYVIKTSMLRAADLSLYWADGSQLDSFAAMESAAA